MRVFIGYDSTQQITYDVLAYSILRNFESAGSEYSLNKIIPLKLSQLELLGFQRPHDILQSTEFTYTRFLVPYLCDYKGLAIFMDSDMLCLGNLNELMNLDMTDYAIRVVKHEHKPTSTVKMTGKVQSAYPRKNWSSLMIMDCAKLTCWQKSDVEQKPGSWLHRFWPIPDNLIGDIPPEWNHLDEIHRDTKMVHYTEGGPWLPNYRNHIYGQPWFDTYKEMLYA